MNDRELRLRERIDALSDQRDDLAADLSANRVELQQSLVDLRENRAALRRTRGRLRERTLSRDLWKLRYARLRRDQDREAKERERRLLENMIGRLTRRKDAA